MRTIYGDVQCVALDRCVELCMEMCRLQILRYVENYVWRCVEYRCRGLWRTVFGGVQGIDLKGCYELYVACVEKCLRACGEFIFGVVLRRMYGACVEQFQRDVEDCMWSMC